MEKAIKWLKGTCNYNLFKSYMEDIKIAIEIAAQEAKQEVFDDIEKYRDDCRENESIVVNDLLKELKKKHLKKA